MKWNVNHITEFLLIYEQYPLLWNIKDKNYCNNKLKETSYAQLYEEFDKKGLVEGVEMKQLKAKIKNVKDVYRHELSKIQKSLKSGSSTDDIYSPKLVWFNAAHFLGEVLLTRSTKSNLDLSVEVKDPIDLEESLSTPSNAKGFSDTEDSATVRKCQMKPPSNPRKKLKKVSTEVEDAIKKLDNIAQSAAEDKPFDCFGKYVAAELRSLPQRKAILLQQEIQNAITNYKLSCLEGTSARTEQLRFSVSPSSSASSCERTFPIPVCVGSTEKKSCDNAVVYVDVDNDILREAIVNSFGK